jgi:diguanylate cyclase (GGDEF)-like protein
MRNPAHLAHASRVSLIRARRPHGKDRGGLSLNVLVDAALVRTAVVGRAVGRRIQAFLARGGPADVMLQRTGRRAQSGQKSLVSWLRAKDSPDKLGGSRAPRVLLAWALLAISVVLLLGQGLFAYFVDHGSVMELALSITIVGLVSSAVMNARASGIEVERRNSEAESFSRIMRALSRSVSPDAVVEAIVHELGASTGADHVAVVRLRPGSTVLDVTFVSMLPGTPASNTVMPLRQLEPVEARLRELSGQPPSRTPLRFVDGDPTPVWRDQHDRSGDPVAAANEATATFRRNIRAGSWTSFQAEERASEVADRIAYRLRDVYGLRNTLAAPLQTGRVMAGAIVLSRRTSDAWPEAAARLLNSAAFEASAALARVYSHQAAESEARTDQLTQLPNRRYFDEYCRLIASRRRSSDRVAIVSIDVDHFKVLNDRYGHQTGDVVLRSIANAIQLSVREEDVPVRFGGEEFLVLLRNPSHGIALEIGERIRQNVREMDLTDAGVPDQVTVSVGVASGQFAGEAIDDIVERADRALYAAKRTGRDRVVEAWQSDVPK